MFENLFRKKLTPDSAVTAAREKFPTPAGGEAPRQAKVKTSPGISADDMQAWRDRIRAAESDEATLLQLAYQAPTTDLKLNALQALKQEDSFKQAMREFREQDKRLYRAAKLRWQGLRDKGVAIAEANALIAAARALLDQEQIPVNRVVELDRAWAAVSGELLDAAVPLEFAALSAQLGAKVRAQGERAQSFSGWLSAVDNVVAQLTAILPGVAQGDIPPAASETLALSMLEQLGNIPDRSDTRCVEKTDVANRLLALAFSVVQRAKFLHTLPAPGIADAASEKAMIEQWREFPEPGEANRNELHSVLAHRFAHWRNASADARKREHDAHGSQERERRAEQNQLHLSAIQRDVEAAEAAHAGGQVAVLTRLLTVIDQALKRGSVNAALNQRIEFLRHEQIRLHDWQRWSDGQSREQLAAEAQALALLASGKIAIKVHAEAIGKLRERWKALDTLGGGSDQTVWLAFDGALKAAYAPVAEHLDKLKLARQNNLAARDQIIAELVQAALKFFPVEQAGAGAIAPPDWRAIAHTLEQARSAWQKLGPVEHTAPRKALQGDNAVTTRYAAARQTLEAPLKNAYGQAREQREQLISAATELGGSDLWARDVVDKVRRLQTRWQAVAKAVPLPRVDENALWAAFKTAIDALFTARDAARVANEASTNAQLKAREEIIESLVAVSALDSASDIKRAVADTDTAWRACADVGGALQAKLDTRYRIAREEATKRLGEIAQRASQARFDALIAAMALCHEREVLNAPISAEQSADLDIRWNAIENLPEAWKAPLAARFRETGASHADSSGSPLASTSGKHPDATLPDALLNLEIACGIDSPSEFLAARQQLKIRALKSAMEGRQTVNTPTDLERWLIEAAAYPRPNELSRERLAKIISAVRLNRPN